MKASVTAFVSGVIFGLGLLVSGMSNPDKVIGFLDLAGQWDPSLALVMGGAIGVAFFGFRLATKRSTGVVRAADAGEVAEPAGIDSRLILGSALFGIGWGITGFCPGPVVVALGLAYWPAVLVGAGMMLGLWLGNRITAKQESS